MTLYCVRGIPGLLSWGEVYEVCHLAPYSGQVTVVCDEGYKFPVRASHFRVETGGCGLWDCTLDVAREFPRELFDRAYAYVAEHY